MEKEDESLSASSRGGASQECWYCPQGIHVEKDEPTCSCLKLEQHFDVGDSSSTNSDSDSHLDVQSCCSTCLASTWQRLANCLFSFTFFGTRFCLHPLSLIARLILLASLYFFLWAALPRPLMDLGGAVFDSLLILFVASVVGGGTARLLKLPALAGIILMGAIWANIPSYNYFTTGIMKETREISSQIGLTVIVCRVGFSLHIPLFLARWKRILALSYLPLLGEALVHAAVALALFDFPDFRWAFLQGILVSAIAPGVVVPPLHELQQEGIGTYDEAVQLLLSGPVVFDSATAVWLSTFFNDLIFSAGERSLAFSIALGPIQLIVGLLLGAIAGWIFHVLVRALMSEAAPTKTIQKSSVSSLHLSYSKEFRQSIHWKALMLFSTIAAGFVFAGGRWKLASGGTMAALSLSTFVSYYWQQHEEAPALHKKSPALEQGITEPHHEGGQGRVEAMSRPREREDEKREETNCPFFNPNKKEEEEENQEVQSSPDMDHHEDDEGGGGGGHSGATRNKNVETQKTKEEVTAEDEEANILLSRFLHDQRTDLLNSYAFLWDNIAMPMLLSHVGAQLIFSKVFTADLFPKAICSILVGVVVRMVLAVVACLGMNLALSQLIFVAFSYIGKGVVQGALANLALNSANEKLMDYQSSAEGRKLLGVGNSSSFSLANGTAGTEMLVYHSLKSHVAFATTIRDVCLLSITLFAPIGALCIVIFGRLLL